MGAPHFSSRGGGAALICPKRTSEMAAWELHWVGKWYGSSSPLSLTLRVRKMPVIIQHNIVEHAKSGEV